MGEEKKERVSQGDKEEKQGRDEKTESRENREGVRMGRRKGGRKDYTMSCMTHTLHMYIN